jgi:hypothetical protein
VYQPNNDFNEEGSMTQQVFSEGEVDFGGYQTLFWNWSGENSKVPAKRVLELTTITLSYFPTGTGTVGRADVSGRDSGGSAVWRLQVVYVEPKKTRHLTFPKGLQLEAGGHVEVGFISDGPGKIFVSANGQLLPK